jgi:ubiquitin carboxyl-terminal hydrolase 4/11/15
LTLPFAAGVYKTELNPDNPLGMNGQVAEAFGQLIQRMWSRNNSGAVAPREFKQALSKFAPSFSGYGQQDSQELLAFLLDGIHEDLNRIMTKPGTNAPDWHGGGDEELVEMAKTCWEQYRSRNDSVIVDLFQGQYRSTVVCPDCSKVSIFPRIYDTLLIAQYSGIDYI